MSNETPVPPGPVQPVVMPDDYWCDDDDDYGYECELCGAAGPLNDMDCDACGAQGCDLCIHHSMDDCIGYLCSACMKALDRGGKSAANVMAMRFGGQQAQHHAHRREGAERMSGRVNPVVVSPQRGLKCEQLRCLRPDVDVADADAELCRRAASTIATWAAWYDEAYTCAALGAPLPWEPGYVPSHIARVAMMHNNVISATAPNL